MSAHRWPALTDGQISDFINTISVLCSSNQHFLELVWKRKIHLGKLLLIRFSRLVPWEGDPPCFNYIKLGLSVAAKDLGLCPQWASLSGCSVMTISLIH